eukprot:6485188-Pyramimonas_sp.AAC.1
MTAMMIRPTSASIAQESFGHQERTDPGGLSRVKPWEAILARHCFDTFCWALEMLSWMWSD